MSDRDYLIIGVVYVGILSLFSLVTGDSLIVVAMSETLGKIAVVASIVFWLWIDATKALNTSTDQNKASRPLKLYVTTGNKTKLAGFPDWFQHSDYEKLSKTYSPPHGDKLPFSRDSVMSMGYTQAQYEELKTAMIESGLLEKRGKSWYMIDVC